MKRTLLLVLALASCEVSTTVAREYEPCDDAAACMSPVACSADDEGEPCAYPSDRPGSTLIGICEAAGLTVRCVARCACEEP